MKRNGIITSYRLLYRRSNDSMIVRQAAVHGNISAHSMKLQQNMDYVVEITGRTSKGPSRLSAKMYIPKSTESKILASCKLLFLAKGSTGSWLDKSLALN